MAQMRFPKFLPALLALLFYLNAPAQQAVVTGVVRNAAGKPIQAVVVADEATGFGEYTNAKGFYLLNIPADIDVTILYAYTGYNKQLRHVRLKAGETQTLDVTLDSNTTQLTEFTKTGERKGGGAGIVPLDLTKLDIMPSTIGGVEGMIKIAVGSHDELTSQYSVRGGSYDENLVYVNDFEIYRPFLVRSGQQEGLSFVNSDLVQNVNFSVGGFQARYGDKLSSVLDVTYKKPTEFAGSVTMSMLGASIHLEGASKNQRLTWLIGARQKSNQYLLQAQPTKGVYNPSFTDLQALIDYKLTRRWDLEAIANYARNRFTFFPETETTSFGVLNQAYQLQVFYSGSEYDQFDSHFGGVSATYHSDNNRFRLKFLASAFQTNEFETYDITGQYLFGELQTDATQANYGQIKTYLGAGGIEDFARNYLTVNVGDVGVRGSYEMGRHFLLFGANGTVTQINDNLHQWEMRDSAGFAQPYDPYGVNMAYYFNSSAAFNYTRFSGFLQDNVHLDSFNRLNASIGVRFNYSLLNQEFLTSPRVQLSYKPLWDNDWVFNFATGFYAQPPFYREMRDMEGNVNEQLKAQQSYQVDAGTEYNFKFHNRPFKIKAELYYKDLWNLDPYVYNNVQVQYTGKNDAIGYVYGGELRLYGDVVKDATSFISIGMLKAAQKITDSGSIPGYANYFALPSDQRFTLGVYFEDYLPRNKNFKVHLNGIYASGLPVGPPGGHLYQNVFRIPSYKRVDIGFSALLLDAKRQKHPAHSLFNNLKSIWASLEVFNLLGIQNTLSYSWIEDDSSQKTFAVPNRLTSRLLNLKMIFKF